jgi:hypothetical protein
MRKLLPRKIQPCTVHESIVIDSEPKTAPIKFMGTWGDGFNKILETHLVHRSLKNKFVEEDIAEYIGDELVKNPELNIRISGKLRSTFSKLDIPIPDREHYRKLIKSTLKKRKLEERVQILKWKSKGPQITLIHSRGRHVLLSMAREEKIKQIDPNILAQTEKEFDEIMARMNSN